MRMLLLCGSFCFAEAMARMLVLRLGWLRLPAVPRSVVCITLFRVALEIGGYAPAAAVAIAAVFELTFFVRACRAIAAGARAAHPSSTPPPPRPARRPVAPSRAVSPPCNCHA